MATHPGEVLMEQVLLPSHISISQAARQLGVSTETLAQVIAGGRPVTASLAHAFAREFGYSCQWWLALQRSWDEEQRLVA